MYTIILCYLAFNDKKQNTLETYKSCLKQVKQLKEIAHRLINKILIL